MASHWSRMSLETQEHPKNKRMAHRDVLNKCKTFARVSKSLCAEIAVYRSRNFVLLERRSLRIDRLTQIPHHFGCRFWGIINVKFWMINVKFYKKLCHIIFHKFLSISRCVRLLQSWTSRYWNSFSRKFKINTTKISQ